ncbi:MAG: hypothetical protein ACLSF6_06080 [Evtepia gabavorous]
MCPAPVTIFYDWQDGSNYATTDNTALRTMLALWCLRSKTIKVIEAT